MTNTILSAIVILLAVIAVLLWTQNKPDQFDATPTPTAAPVEPIETGNPAPTSTPDTSNVQIILDQPQPKATISSPLTISGQARGTWYFEATFPVVLTNWDGLIIAEGYATADGDWMTEEFVPFTATLEFETPDYGERGSLILQKANPSDLPENDDALEIEVRFETE